MIVPRHEADRRAILSGAQRSRRAHHDRQRPPAPSARRPATQREPLLDPERAAAIPLAHALASSIHDPPTHRNRNRCPRIRERAPIADPGERERDPAAENRKSRPGPPKARREQPTSYLKPRPILRDRKPDG